MHQFYQNSMGRTQTTIQTQLNHQNSQPTQSAAGDKRLMTYNRCSSSPLPENTDQKKTFFLLIFNSHFFRRNLTSLFFFKGLKEKKRFFYSSLLLRRRDEGQIQTDHPTNYLTHFQYLDITAYRSSIQKTLYIPSLNEKQTKNKKEKLLGFS